MKKSSCLFAHVSVEINNHTFIAAKIKYIFLASWVAQEFNTIFPNQAINHLDLWATPAHSRQMCTPPPPTPPPHPSKKTTTTIHKLEQIHTQSPVTQYTLARDACKTTFCRLMLTKRGGTKLFLLTRLFKRNYRENAQQTRFVCLWHTLALCIQHSVIRNSHQTSNISGCMLYLQDDMQEMYDIIGGETKKKNTVTVT